MPDSSKADADHFEREKRQFDEKVSKGRYAYLVKHEDFYQGLISSLESNSAKMKQSIELGEEQMGKILQLRADGGKIRDKLNQIVTECIEVDMQSLLTSNSSPEE